MVLIYMQIYVSIFMQGRYQVMQYLGQTFAGICDIQVINILNLLTFYEPLIRGAY